MIIDDLKHKMGDFFNHLISKEDQDINAKYQVLCDSILELFNKMKEGEKQTGLSQGMSSCNLDEEFFDVNAPKTKNIQKIKFDLLKSFKINPENSNISESSKVKSPKETILKIKYLESKIKGLQKQHLFYYKEIGALIFDLKSIFKSRYVDLLHKNDIKYVKSHVSFLIKFHLLCNDYPKLLNSTLPLRFFKQNIKEIRGICETTNLE